MHSVNPGFNNNLILRFQICIFHNAVNFNITLCHNGKACLHITSDGYTSIVMNISYRVVYISGNL